MNFMHAVFVLLLSESYQKSKMYDSNNDQISASCHITRSTQNNCLHNKSLINYTTESIKLNNTNVHRKTEKDSLQMTALIVHWLTVFARKHPRLINTREETKISNN